MAISDEERLQRLQGMERVIEVALGPATSCWGRWRTCPGGG
jgi:hypothetical protein